MKKTTLPFHHKQLITIKTIGKIFLKTMEFKTLNEYFAPMPEYGPRAALNVTTKNIKEKLF
jgi:hypothetical protein